MNRRREFTAQTQRQALERSGGICECHLLPHVFPVACGRPLGPGDTFFEHGDPDNLRKDNSLSNCYVLVRNCWRFKTSTFDLPIIAKAKRNHDAHNGIRRIKKRLPGSRHDPFKFTPGSTIPIDRKTGEVWKR